MNALRLLCVAALAAALPFAASAQLEAGTGTPPVVNLKPPPDSATPQAADSAGPKGDAHGGRYSRMDTNNDGKLSREEFLSYHERMYDRMEKTPDGQVDLKNMKNMHAPRGAGR